LNRERDARIAVHTHGVPIERAMAGAERSSPLGVRSASPTMAVAGAPHLLDDVDDVDGADYVNREHPLEQPRPRVPRRLGGLLRVDLRTAGLGLSSNNGNCAGNLGLLDERASAAATRS